MRAGRPARIEGGEPGAVIAAEALSRVGCVGRKGETPLRVDPDAPVGVFPVGMDGVVEKAAGLDANAEWNDPQSFRISGRSG